MKFTKRRILVFFSMWVPLGLPFLFVSIGRQEDKGVVVLWQIFVVAVYAWKVWRRKDMGKLRKIIMGYLVTFPSTIAGILTEGVFGKEVLGVMLFAFVFLMSPTYEVPAPTLENIKKQGKLATFMHRWFDININTSQKSQNNTTQDSMGTS